MENLIMQLIGGLVGGNVAGSLNKNASMGTGLNSIVGLIGGVGGAKLLALLPFLTSLLDSKGGFGIGNIISQVAGGGVGGLVLTMIAGMIKNAMGGGGKA